MADVRDCSDVEKKLDRILDSQESMRADISELKRTVRGHNGTPGLVAEVAIIKEKIEDHLEYAEKEAERQEKKLVEGRAAFTNKLAVETLKPVVIAFIIWVLLTLIPQFIGHIGIGG